MITSDQIRENPIGFCLGEVDFQPTRIFLKVGRFELKRCEHEGLLELVLFDEDGQKQSTSAFKATGLDWKRSLLYLKINETGTDADVSASHTGLKDVVIPLGKASDIIRKLKSMLENTD